MGGNPYRAVAGMEGMEGYCMLRAGDSCETDGDIGPVTGRRGIMLIDGSGAEPLRPLVGSMTGGGRKSIVDSTARRPRMVGRRVLAMICVVA